METILADPCAARVRGIHGLYGRRAPAATPESTASPMARVGDVSRFDLRQVGLVHDLRNLLQVVSSALQLIDREADRGATANVHRLAQSALRSVDRAAVLSRAILDAAPKPAVSAEVVDLAAAIAAMRDLISLTAGRSVVVDIFAESGAPSVRCDRGEFEDVLLNLIANARDAMPEGGRVTISLSRSLSGASAPTSHPGVVLRVDDTGHGMSDSTRLRALTPFFTTKPMGRGTGLGLAIVNDFATRAGGSVEIESAVGAGTSVIVCLPVDETVIQL